MTLTLEKIVNKLEKYFIKELTLDDLKEWTFDLIFDDKMDFKKNEESLIKEILFLIDDDSINEDYIKRKLTEICIVEQKEFKILEQLLKIIRKN